MTFLIKQEKFEGPFDLLLSLVEARKFFVNDISLAAVTEDYIRFVSSMDEQSIDDLTSFISVAATLILIKSKSLLPTLELSKDESSAVDDLERRLILYGQIEKQAKILAPLVSYRKLFFHTPEKMQPVFSPHESITKENLLNALQDVFRALPEAVEKKPELTLKKIMTIEEMIDSIAVRVQKGLQFSFRDMSGYKKGTVTKEEKITVIVSFLALLELVRQGIVSAVQGSDFDDITIDQPEEVIIPQETTDQNENNTV